VYWINRYIFKHRTSQNLLCAQIFLFMGTISGTTHIKTMFSFSPGTGKHFINNAPGSSDGSVTQLIHVLLYTNKSLLTKPQKKKSRGSNMKDEGPGNGSPFFLSNDQKIPCPERHDHGWRSGGGRSATSDWKTVPTGT
jgi:hypothetical protein